MIVTFSTRSYLFEQGAVPITPIVVDALASSAVQTEVETFAQSDNGVLLAWLATLTSVHVTTEDRSVLRETAGLRVS